jgi:hypothetical protein
MTCNEMIQHVVNHGTYHRGFVGDMMYQAGVTPSATTFLCSCATWRKTLGMDYERPGPMVPAVACRSSRGDRSKRFL